MTRYFRSLLVILVFYFGFCSSLERDPLNNEATRWAVENLDELNIAFEPDNNDAVKYIPVFFMLNNHLVDVVLDLYLIEAKIYSNYPELGFGWLYNYPKEFENAKLIGRDLFIGPCESSVDIQVSIDLGKNLINKLKNHLRNPQLNEHQKPLIEEMLDNLERLNPGNINNYVSYCKKMMTPPY